MFYCNGKQAVCDVPCTNLACEHYDGTGATAVIPEKVAKEVAVSIAKKIEHGEFAEGISRDDTAFKKGLNAGFAAGKTEGRLDAYEELEGVLLEAAQNITNSVVAKTYRCVVDLVRDLKREADS